MQWLIDRLTGLFKKPRTTTENALPPRIDGETPLDYLLRTMPDTIPQTEMSKRRKHLFTCYLSGNDAYPSPVCPHPEGSDEAAEWIAGWYLADKGMLVEGREDRIAAAIKQTV